MVLANPPALLDGSSGGDLVVTDTNNHRLVRVGSDGGDLRGGSGRRFCNLAERRWRVVVHRDDGGSLCLNLGLG